MMHKLVRRKILSEDQKRKIRSSLYVSATASRTDAYLGEESMNERVTILFVGGYSRSGSTLLDRMLGQIPGFFSVGELRHVWERGFRDNQLCGCGQPFHSCEFWTAVGNEAYGGLNKVDLDKVFALKRTVDRIRYIPHHFLAAKIESNGKTAERVRQYAVILERLYRAVQEVSGATVIVDSSKVSAFAFLLNRLPSMDLRLIHLARDSRAVAFSWQRQKVRPEITSHVEYLPRIGAAKVSFEWNLANYLIDLFSTFVGYAPLLRYEDLVRDPASHINRILIETGLGKVDDLPFIRGRHLTLGTNHVVAGNPMRFEHEAIELRPDEEWRLKMGVASRRVVTALTVDLLRRYGYLDRNGRLW